MLYESDYKDLNERYFDNLNNLSIQVDNLTKVIDYVIESMKNMLLSIDVAYKLNGKLEFGIGELLVVIESIVVAKEIWIAFNYKCS